MRKKSLTNQFYCVDNHKRKHPLITQTLRKKIFWSVILSNTASVHWGDFQTMEDIVKMHSIFESIINNPGQTFYWYTCSDLHENQEVQPHSSCSEISALASFLAEFQFHAAKMTFDEPQLCESVLSALILLWLHLVFYLWLWLCINFVF